MLNKDYEQRKSELVSVTLDRVLKHLSIADDSPIVNDVPIISRKADAYDAIKDLINDYLGEYRELLNLLHDVRSADTSSDDSGRTGSVGKDK